MKKLACLVLALCLIMSVSLAEEAAELTWDMFAPILEAGGVTGQFYAFEEVNVLIWLPDGMDPVELTDEDKAEGYIGYFAPEDDSAAVSEVLVKNKPCPVEMIGAQDEFGEVGPVEYLRERFHLTDKDIAAAVKKVIARK